MPAGSLPAGEVKLRFRIALFATAVPEDNASVPCAKRGLLDKARSATVQSP
jgi:hypothetical protein